MKDIDDLFGTLKKGPLKSIFDPPPVKPKPKPEEPKWPSVKIKLNK